MKNNTSFTYEVHPKLTNTAATLLGTLLVFFPTFSIAQDPGTALFDIRTLMLTQPLTNNDMRSVMIKESNELNGRCACPYSPDGIGGVCGTESKYYKPGGFRIYCYMYDITSEEVYFWRLRKDAIFIASPVEEVVEAAPGKPKEDFAANYFKNNSPTYSKGPAGGPSAAGGPTAGGPKEGAGAESPTTSYFTNNAVPSHPSTSAPTFPSASQITGGSGSSGANYLSPTNPMYSGH
ncbi:MAG: hypothetical protein ACHQJ6_08495 [Candidatus Berkiellales bacterium]